MNTNDSFTIDMTNAFSRQRHFNRQIFDRKQGAFARAERRLLVTPEERNSRHMLAPITGDPNNMHSLLPQTKAPIDFKCSVCIENIKKGQDQQLLNCGHKFCASCINKWLERNASCPICRTPVYNQSMNQPPRQQHMRMTPQQEALAILMRNINNNTT